MRATLRLTAAVLLLPLLLAAAPSPAPTPSIEVPDFVTALDDAAAGLVEDPLYVDEGADPTLSEDERAALSVQLEDAGLGESVAYVAVLDAGYLEDSGATIGGLPSEVIARTGRPGVIMVVVGTQAAYGQTATAAFPEGTAAAAGEAIGGAQLDGDLAAAVAVFADEVVRRGGGAPAQQEDDASEVASEEAAAEPAAPAPETEEEPGGTGLGWLWPIALLALVALAVALWLRARRGDVARPTGKVEGVRATAREDLQALRRALAGLGETPEGDAAVARKAAQAAETTAAQAIDAAQRPEDFLPIAQTLREGAAAVVRARAAAAGRPVPADTTLCVFDPRHGPAAREVLWTPPGASARRVPACARDAERVEAGETVAPRTVRAGGMARPYWDAPEYGPWAEGWYGTRAHFSGLRIGSQQAPR